MVLLLVLLWQTDVNVDVLWWVVAVVMSPVSCRHLDVGVVLEAVDRHRRLVRMARWAMVLVGWFLHILGKLVFVMVGGS